MKTEEKNTIVGFCFFVFIVAGLLFFTIKYADYIDKIAMPDSVGMSFGTVFRLAMIVIAVLAIIFHGLAKTSGKRRPRAQEIHQSPFVFLYRWKRRLQGRRLV